MKKRWAALGAAGSAFVTLLACSSFDASPAPPGDDGSAPEAASPVDASTAPDVAPDSAKLCVPAPLEPSDAGEDANCEGTGVTIGLDTSSKHCGRCGHDCLGTACVNGVCAVVPLSSELGSIAVTAATATHLYYSSSGSSSRRVRRFSFADGGVEELANPSGIGYLKETRAVGPTPSVYAVLSDRGVIAVPVGGGSESTVVDDGNNNVDRMAADETNLYWTRSGTLLARAHADGTSVPANFVVHSAKTAVVATALFADGAHLFYAVRDTGDGGTTTSIWMRGPGKLDSVSQRLPSVEDVVDFAGDAEFLYWTTPKGEIWRAAKTGTAKPELVARVPGLRLYSKGLAVDDAYVYAAMTLSGLGGDVQMTLVQASKCGGPIRVLVNDAIFGGGLVAAGGYLYWGSSPSLQRIAK